MTGSCIGLGAAIAERLAGDGARVVVTGYPHERGQVLGTVERAVVESNRLDRNGARSGHGQTEQHRECAKPQAYILVPDYHSNRAPI